MAAWLDIVGVGEGGLGDLPLMLRQLLDDADTILGPARFLAGIEPPPRRARPRPELPPDLVAQRSLEAVARALLSEDEEDGPPLSQSPDGRTLIEWEPPLEQMIAQVMKLRDRPTVILASGDPMWFGIGATLARHLMPSEYNVHPSPSAFQLAAARMHWPLQSVVTLSLHGRPVESVHPHVLPGNRILALTSDHSTVDLVLELLVDRGYGKSFVTTLENLGGEAERLTTAEAESFDTDEIGDFYVLAVDCVPEVTTAVLAPVPGLPDDAFVSDGQITKREVRAATIARLAPFPGALLWDVGAGCGSVAIEWMRGARDARAIAFEREGERLQMIAVNAAALGVPGIRIENGEAPQSLAGMPPPDAVFIGGSVADETLFEACWSALKPGGRLVANAVTFDGERALYDRHEQLGGELVRIEVATLDKIGGQRAFRPRMPVIQWAVTKALHGLVVTP